MRFFSSGNGNGSPSPPLGWAPRCAPIAKHSLAASPARTTASKSLSVRAGRAIGALVETRKVRAERAGQLLAAFSYRGVLSRGFALVRDEGGRPLRSAAAVAPGQRLDIEFADGRRGATADGSGRRPRRPLPRPAVPAAAAREAAAPAARAASSACDQTRTIVSAKLEHRP